MLSLIYGITSSQQLPLRYLNPKPAFFFLILHINFNSVELKWVVGWWWGLRMIPRVDSRMGHSCECRAWRRSLAQSADPELSRFCGVNRNTCHRQHCSSSVGLIALISTAWKAKPAFSTCGKPLGPEPLQVLHLLG